METKKGISGSTLKLIAIITMFFDHLGAILVGRMVMSSGIQEAASELAFVKSHIGLFVGYQILRLIGRLGFPLFAFLLVEGFHYTRNKYKYAERLAMFAVISEVPFDLAFCGKILEFTNQNVFFTLLLGLLTLMVIEKIEEKYAQKHIWKTILWLLAVAAGAGIAVFMKTDYNGWGVFVIVVMYELRNMPFREMLAGCVILNIMSLYEITCFFDLIPIKHYNGTRGLKLKYVFYFFYPVHLLLLYLLTCLLGYGNVSLV